MKPFDTAELIVCPIGLDKTPDLCSAGTCFQCQQMRRIALDAGRIKRRQLNEQYKVVEEHCEDCNCYFCDPQV